MPAINYMPSDSDIKKVKQEMSRLRKDKLYMDAALLKKFRSNKEMNRMAKKGIYYLLAYMSEKGFDFKTAPKITNGQGNQVDGTKSYLQLILEYIKNYSKSLSSGRDVIDCLNNAFEESVSEKNKILRAIQTPNFVDLGKFITQEDTNNSKNSLEKKDRRNSFGRFSIHHRKEHRTESGANMPASGEHASLLPRSVRDGNVAGPIMRENHVHSSASKTCDLSKTKSKSSLESLKHNFVAVKERIEREKKMKPKIPTVVRSNISIKNPQSAAPQPPKNNTQPVASAPIDNNKTKKTNIKRSFSLNLSGRENVKEKLTTSRMRRHSFSGSIKTELRGTLLSMIDSNKEILTDFYDNNKDQKYPDFENNFNDLKKVLNGGVRGAEKLEFDKFVNKYIKKLDEREIRNCIDLMTKAISYDKEVDSLKKSFESDKKTLDKKFQKINELYNLQSNCKLFNELGKFCTGYKDLCLGYLSENVKGEFNKKFDYQKLKDQFSPDILKVYGTKSDFYHGKLLSDYRNNKTYAKLTINQEYGQVNDKTFNPDISLFEKCREKTGRFLNDMYKYTCENCDEYTPVHIIPRADIEKANQMFSRIIESLKKMRDDWNKL